MVLGLYYATMERKGMTGEGMKFADIDEVEHALAAGEVEDSRARPESLRLKKVRQSPGRAAQRIEPVQELGEDREEFGCGVDGGGDLGREGSGGVRGVAF
jgi:hypothetical protein